MPHGPLTFRQRDVEAAIRAARAAGCEVVRVEIDKAGKISVVTSRDAPPHQAPERASNPWDEVFNEGDVALRP